MTTEISVMYGSEMYHCKDHRIRLYFPWSLLLTLSPSSAATVFRRQILASVDVRFGHNYKDGPRIERINKIIMALDPY